MATRRTHHRGRGTTDDDERQEAPEADQEGARSSNAGAGSEAAKRPAMERAEELADRLGEQIGHYASVVGYNVLRFFARAREEAEDIWAEAQSIRRGGKPPEA